MPITRFGKIVTATVVPTIAAATVLTFTAPDDQPSAINVVNLPSDAAPTPSVGPDETTPSPTPTPTVSPTAAEQRAARPSSPAPTSPATTQSSATPSKSTRPTGPSPKPSPSAGSNPVEDLMDALF